MVNLSKSQILQGLRELKLTQGLSSYFAKWLPGQWDFYKHLCDAYLGIALVKHGVMITTISDAWWSGCYVVVSGLCYYVLFDWFLLFFTSCLPLLRKPIFRVLTTNTFLVHFNTFSIISNLDFDSILIVESSKIDVVKPYHDAAEDT